MERKTHIHDHLLHIYLPTEIKSLALGRYIPVSVHYSVPDPSVNKHLDIQRTLLATNPIFRE